MRRRRQRQLVDKNLLNAIFYKEYKWRKLRDIVDRSVDPLDEARHKLKLAEATYMFLLKEAKHRKISALRME
ncbi:MAG TPA: YaaL family protein [Pseudogracilibacillus sp.]|nr:YaaL family protein [Pseudogracilibacillus sp.]